MSLNTFENHYLNRNLDRTGQQSIVITPGVPHRSIEPLGLKITLNYFYSNFKPVFKESDYLRLIVNSC